MTRASAKRTYLFLAIMGVVCMGKCGACVESVESTDDYIIDAFGRAYQHSNRPMRVVSLSPNLTEMIFSIGIDASRLVGVTRYCDYPEAALSIPKVGGVVDPSVEGILALRPDLVLATRGNPVAALDRLRSLGVPVFAFESQTGLDQVPQTMRVLAHLLGEAPDENRADSLAAELVCLRRLVEAIPASERPSVYYYDPTSPDWTAGPRTHISELIRVAGGRNVADDAPSAWPRYSVEALIAHPPDWLLIAVPGPSAEGAAEILSTLRSKPGWRSLDAVRQGRVCLVPADPLLRPSPRTMGVIRMVGACLHPSRVWECGP